MVAIFHPCRNLAASSAVADTLKGSCIWSRIVDLDAFGVVKWSFVRRGCLADLYAVVQEYLLARWVQSGHALLEGSGYRQGPAQTLAGRPSCQIEADYR